MVAITVEGKESESYDKNLSECNREGFRGKETQLAFIKDKLGLADEVLTGICYQLLHRTTSAIMEAEWFTATSAMKIAHSFSQSDLWFEDYQAFIHLYSIENAVIGKLYFLREITNIKLFAG